MTWREFQLRRAGYLREEKRRWEHSRSISYYSLVATGAIDTRKMSLEKFMPLDGTSQKGIMSDEQKEAMIKARERVKEQLNGSRT